jgi:hypothetical protein
MSATEMITGTAQADTRAPLAFHRRFARFTGGHLKVWDYFNHVLHSRGFQPWVYFEPGSRMDETNPWHGSRDRFLQSWPPADDVPLFLAGHDWEAVPHEAAGPARPIINLIQNFTHVNPADPRCGYLSRRAIRICVSAGVADALRETRRVNGPLYTIPNGLDPGSLPPVVAQDRRSHDLCVVAVKARPASDWLAQAISAKFSGALRLRIVDQPLPRREFLDVLAQSRAALFLPRRREGFYLPPLEAMALDTFCICPDVIGNREFCVHGQTCLMPGPGVAELMGALEDYQRLDEAGRAAIRAGARRVAADLTLATERARFFEILDHLHDLW